MSKYPCQRTIIINKEKIDELDLLLGDKYLIKGDNNEKN